ncbi:hypothetical protein TWF718_009985 [Orbilia javanica]|uniref:Uncharacterized protein n=1 Tax=Orbilia javanica TaxID=47235 RepID=A0AAN8MQK4_9PEZI
MVHLAYFTIISRCSFYTLILLLIALPLGRPNLVLAQAQKGNDGPAGVNENLKWKEHCTSEQASGIDEAFDVVKSMLAGVQTPDWTSYAAVEYLGTNYIRTWGNYEGKVKRMFKKAYEWVARSYWFSGPYILCEVGQTQGCHTRYETDKIFMFYEGDDYVEDAQLRIAICQSWFNKPSLKTLISQAKYCRDNVADEARRSYSWDIRFYESREFWLLHAIFHVREVYFNLATELRSPDDNELTKYLLMPPPFHDYVRLSYKYGAWEPVLGPWAAKKLATNGVGRPWEASGPLGSASNFALYVLAEYITKETNEYPYAPSRYKNGRDWVNEEHLLKMCTSDPYKIGMVDTSSYKPDETKLAIAPWLFTPQTPPAAE